MRLILILILFFYACSHTQAQKFPDLRKVVCLKSLNGCPCASENGPVTVYHAESAEVISSANAGEVTVRVGDRVCRMSESQLIRMDYPHVLKTSMKMRDHAPLPLKQFIQNYVETPTSAQRYALGNFWPTYYHLALEDMYPGKEVPILDPQGKILGNASDEFLRQVTWEGSGLARNGMGVQYAGPGRYSLYPADKVWGYGAGRRYQILPFRTIAVNFDGFCARLKDKFPGCTSRDVLGLLLYSPQIAEKKIRMQDGTIHDGYLCATDTGSPYYIRADRIDIFAGMQGGGNPFLPPERRGNDFIDGGLPPILPSDWRIWNGVNDRLWCNAWEIPRDPFNPKPGECTHDYHVVAKHKSVQLFALFDAKGKALRCNPFPL